MNFTKAFKNLGVTALAALCLCSSVRADEAEDYARWYFSPGLGFYLTEGDQPLADGFQLDLRLGYNVAELLSAEVGILWAPTLDEQFVTGDGAHLFKDADGKPYYDNSRSKSRSRGKDSDFGDTFMIEPYVDLLFHYTYWGRFDPFLSAGLGLNIYGKDVVDGGTTEFVYRLGAGFFYHFSDEFALRADWRLIMATDNTEFNSAVDVGLAWFWGAEKEAEIIAAGGPVDSDGDGLIDTLEATLGTDPYNPDTDGDGLLDGEEYYTYHTDPLNRDSDFDGLLDGEEVKKYKTDPLDPDTDKGGVRDGHEVLVDRTNPLNGNDDLLRVELHLLFDYDKDVIHSSDYEKLDQVAKVLLDHPEATAEIEGHADQLQRSKRNYNLKLSDRRATAVKNYFIAKGVAAENLKSIGYGFDRPLNKPDLVKGNPEHRRVEVYIRGVSDKGISDTLKKIR